jgi:signal transduction histidine kinase
MKRTTVVATLILIVAAPMLAACANPGATTCDQYAALSRSERGDVESALLKAHNLEVYSVSNALGITQAIDKYCGVQDNAFGPMPGSTKATLNNSSPIDQAVDWSTKKW